MTGWRRVPPAARAGLLAALVCAADLLTQWSERVGTVLDVPRAPLPVVIGYAAAGYAALTWRRRRPGLVFAIVLVHNLIGQLVLPWRPLLGVVVALYTVAAYRGLRPSLVALGGTGAAFTVSVVDETLYHPADLDTEFLGVNILAYAMLALAVWGAGRFAHRSRHRLRDAEQRRAAAVADERARIARELHDIVAHSVTVMVLQAAGARRVPQPGDPRVTEALTHIERTGRQAMEELRRMLRVLTTVDDPGRTGPPEDLTGLDGLVSRICAAGLPVEVDHRGTPRPLDPSVGLAAHRVVSEGLTNALKHAGAGARTRVLLDWTGDHVTVSVTDDGRGAPPAGAEVLSSGRGLIGLRERVRAAGGELWAGPLPAGGYRVSADLPVAAR